jgi:hypothetical protein
LQAKVEAETKEEVDLKVEAVGKIPSSRHKGTNRTFLAR